MMGDAGLNGRQTGVAFLLPSSEFPIHSVLPQRAVGRRRFYSDDFNGQREMNFIA